MTPTPSTPSTSSTPSTVTESRFAALKKKLRELFELDKSDLDFGIYRIMAAKNKEVTDFLDRQLKDVVRETLAGHGVTAVAQIDAEIAEARQAAQDAGFNPDDSPKVKELQAKRDTIGGGTAADRGPPQSVSKRRLSPNHGEMVGGALCGARDLL